MKGAALGLVVGFMLATVSSGVAGPPSSTRAAQECGPQGTAPASVARHCVLVRAESYYVEMPSLDLSCYLRAKANDDDGTYLACYRTSTHAKCLRGRTGSLTSWITPSSMYFGFASKCIRAASPAGYRITAVGKNTRKYPRSP